jgi:hypothetical protein
LAIVTGVFACGGFFCSLFFVEGDADFPQPHHWLRKSYSSPVMTLPPAASIVPQNIPPRLNHENKHCGIAAHPDWPSRIAFVSQSHRPLKLRHSTGDRSKDEVDEFLGKSA